MKFGELGSFVLLCLYYYCSICIVMVVNIGVFEKGFQSDVASVYKEIVIDCLLFASAFCPDICFLCGYILRCGKNIQQLAYLLESARKCFLLSTLTCSSEG